MKKVLAIIALALFIGGTGATAIAATIDAPVSIELREDEKKDKKTENTTKKSEATQKSSDCTKSAGGEKKSDCSKSCEGESKK